MRVKWTLSYNGEKKVYVLTEYHEADGEWYKINTSEWTYIDAPLETIRKSNAEYLREFSR